MNLSPRLRQTYKRRLAATTSAALQKPHCRIVSTVVLSVASVRLARVGTPSSDAQILLCPRFQLADWHALEQYTTTTQRAHFLPPGQNSPHSAQEYRKWSMLGANPDTQRERARAIRSARAIGFIFFKPLNQLNQSNWAPRLVARASQVQPLNHSFTSATHGKTRSTHGCTRNERANQRRRRPCVQCPKFRLAIFVPFNDMDSKKCSREHGHCSSRQHENDRR